MTDEPELITELPEHHVDIMARMLKLFEAKNIDSPNLSIPIVAALTLCEPEKDHEAVEALRPYARDYVYRAAIAFLDLFEKAEAIKARIDKESTHE